MTGAPPRIAVVGAGYWGINLVRVVAEFGALVAVCDLDAQNIARARELAPNVWATANFDELLEPARHVDAIVLAVPAPLHARYALAAIAAGKGVFVEKPLALTGVDAETIVRAAQRAGCKLFTGHLLLYHPGVRAVLDCIARGAIGEVVHVRSRRLSWGKLRAVENVWWSFAPHDVALVLAVFGNELPATVQAAQTARLRPAVADFAYADLGFANGRTAHIEVGWREVDKTARLDVFGTTGVLTFNDSREAASVRLTPGGVRDEAGGATLWRSAPSDIPFAAGEPLKAEIGAFIDWLRGGIEPPTAGSEGLDVVRVLELAQRAAESAPHRIEALA